VTQPSTPLVSSPISLLQADFAHASGEVLVADLTRPLLVLGYLLVLALLHDAAPTALLAGAGAGALLGLVLVVLTQRRRIALARLARLQHRVPPGLPLLGSLAFFLMLPLTLLDGGAFWLGLVRQWPQLSLPISLLVTALFVAWQWWFFIYWLSPPVAEEARPAHDEL
jgi:hypothetical protein